MRDAEMVDYSHPGFSVVYLEDRPSPTGSSEIALRESPIGPRFSPAQSAVGVGGTIVVINETDRVQVLTCPRLDVWIAVDPGERLELDAREAGSIELFLIEGTEAHATVFSSPGPFSVVDAGGNWWLLDQPPGAREAAGLASPLSSSFSRDHDRDR